jgi:oligo-alginate lyase
MKPAGVVCLLALSLCGPAAAEKRESVFFPKAVVERAQANARAFDWAARIQKKAVADAERWRALSDEQLWRFMFGPAITRTHMVWSSGYCPACRKPMPMYDWKIDAWERPWKVKCPHCNQLFPKNDFEAYYRSGFDEHGVFDPKKANRALLVNLEHPAADDPQRGFGVDDGEGYVEGDKRWRFIGAYLLYGQWSQLIEAGVKALSTAYTVTGDPVYAHKAGVLLDRVADLWPTFDYATQGLVYERVRYGGGMSGYVYYSIESAYNAMELVTAYDKIFDGIRDDGELVKFLGGKDSSKSSFAAVQRNIEDRILRHVLANPFKIRTNYPGAERTLSLIRTVLDWPANREELRGEVDEIVRRSTLVDGLSGEKGLNSYATMAPRLVGEVLEEYARIDPGMLAEMLARNPKLKETYHFHVDTWMGKRYYPYSGDAGSYARQADHYAGLTFSADDTADAVSPFSFLRHMWKATGDPLFGQIAWEGNGGKADGLPRDIYAEDAGAMPGEVSKVVAASGAWPKVGSVNKKEWRLGILRHHGAPDQAVWMDYDSVPEGALKNHYHLDAMNIGLVAKGLDVMPEFGYPAVQFGDWHTKQALWHRKTAAHNTVVVDGKDQFGGATEATLWHTEGPVQVIRASSPAQFKGTEYERTVAMVETGPKDFYVLDVFRVAGGRDHAKFTHSNFAAATTAGLKLAAAGESFYGPEMMVRNLQVDRQPAAEGWSVDWAMEDKYGYRQAGAAPLHLRYTDLTRGAEAYTGETWTVESSTSSNELWIPTVMVRRRAGGADGGPLRSAFVSVLDPYEGAAPQVKRVRRVDREGDGAVRVIVELADGRRDVLVSDAGGVTWERRDARGRVTARGAAVR